VSSIPGSKFYYLEGPCFLAQGEGRQEREKISLQLKEKTENQMIVAEYAWVKVLGGINAPNGGKKYQARGKP